MLCGLAIPIEAVRLESEIHTSNQWAVVGLDNARQTRHGTGDGLFAQETKNGQHCAIEKQERKEGLG